MPVPGIINLQPAGDVAIELKPTGRRIEIKAVTLKDGSKGLYWRWRWTVNGRRRSAYGGRMQLLNNQERIREYHRNSKKWKRRNGKET